MSAANTDGLTHLQLRERAVKEIGSNILRYKPLLTDEELKNENLKIRCARMFESGQYAEHPEVASTCRVLNCDFFIHRKSQNTENYTVIPLTTDDNNSVVRTKVHLLHSHWGHKTNCHYDLMVAASLK